MAKRRKPNWRCIKTHRNYTVDDVSRKLGVAKGTVRRWLKNGLPAITDKKPALILGSDLIDFHKSRAAPKQPCQPDEFFCVKCRARRVPAGHEVEYVPFNSSNGNLRGLCPECATLIHRRISFAKLPTLQGIFYVSVTRADKHLVDSTDTCPNDHFQEQVKTQSKEPSFLEVFGGSDRTSKGRAG